MIKVWREEECGYKSCLLRGINGYVKQWKIVRHEIEKEHPNKMKSQWENLKVAETIVHLGNMKSLVWLKHSKVGWTGDTCYFCSVAKSFETSWSAAQHTSLSFTISQSLLKLMATESVILSNYFILCHPFLLLPSIFPSIRVFLSEWLLASSGQSIRASASASVLPMNIQGWFPSDWLVCSPCSPRDSQKSSPTPHFKSINSLAFSFLHSPTLTSIHDYWKNHSFD